MIKRPFVWIALAYLVGCLLYQQSWIVVGGILFFLVIILNLIFYRSTVFNNNQTIVNKLKERITVTKEDRFLLLIPVVIVAGCMRMNMQISPTALDKCFERNIEVSLEGTINRVTSKDETISYYLSNVIIYPNQDERIPINQKVIAYVKIPTNEQANYLVGNRVYLQGKLCKILEATNEGQFDAYNYYISQNVRYQMFVTSHSIMKDTNSWYVNLLMSLRSRIAKVYEKVLSGESAGIMKAMLLGMNSELTSEVKSMYQKNGIAHILAISGLHISFIGLFLYKLLKKIDCPLVINSILVATFIFSYGKMTNFSVSTNRAVVMLLVSLGGIILGRTYDMLSSLSLSVCIIITQSPMQVYNAGFQLSFVAVLVLATLVSRVNEVEFEQEQAENPESIRNRLTRKWKVYNSNNQRNKATHPAVGLKRLRREVRKRILTYVDNFVYTLQKKHKKGQHRVLDMNIIISAAILPIIARNYMEIPIYGFLINLLVIPLSSSLILLGLVVGLVGLFWIDLAKFIAPIITMILNLYQIFCKFFSSLPFHLILTGKPSMIQVVLYYIVFLVLIGIIIVRKRRRWIYLIVFLWIGLIRIPVNELQITMLDVSQGDSIYIKTPKNTHILIDGGSSDVKKIGQYRIEPFLKAQGVYQLDYAVLTHMDDDHINGIVELLEKMEDCEGREGAGQGISGTLLLHARYDGTITVRNLILPEINRIDETYKKIELLAQQKGVPIIYFGTGDCIEEGNVRITCLHPSYEYVTDSKNDTSIVLELRYEKFTALFLGDLESKGEQELIKNKHLLAKSYQLIKVGHHGSKYSTSEEFLAQIRARYALISSGYNNRYGHPHKEVLERLEAYGVKYYTTIGEGAITIRTDGEKMWWSYSKKEWQMSAIP